MAFAERWFTARDGLRLYYREYGAARPDGRPAVLCLGGLTRNSKDFHAPAMRLATRYRVLCPDYRGRGRSAYDPDPFNYRPETYLEDLRHLLCVAQCHRVVVLGTSLGGLLAMAMGVAMPTALAGALLNDVGPALPQAGLAPIIAYLKDDRPAASWEDAAGQLRRAFPTLPATTEADWQAIARATFVAGPDGRLRRDWDPAIVRPLTERPLPDTDLWPLFGALRRVPLAVVRGEKSAVLPAAVLQRMIARHPGLIHGVVPGVGHAPNLNDPISTETIDALLAALPDR